MSQKSRYDAVIVGSGPNGLSAGIALAQQGCSVLILEAAQTTGGGVRSEELTLPGFVHDSCASLFPLTLVSPFLSNLPLEKFGLEWVHSPVVLAHPLPGGRAMIVDRSLECTVERLATDRSNYLRLLQPILADWEQFSKDLLCPLPLPPRSPLTFLGFSVNAIQPATFLARRIFKSGEGRAMFAGMAGHSMLPLEHIASGAFGIVLSATAHAVGWPFPKGGARSLSQAMIAYFHSLGGEIVNGFKVEKLDQLPEYRTALFDVAPQGLLSILGEELPSGYRRALRRFRYGPGVCKVDFALDAPVPWACEEAALAATLHLGGSIEEIAAAERAVARGEHPQEPFVIVAQTSLFDPSRAPAGQHTLWAYSHVPNGSKRDISAQIESQIERFAPGFKQHILAKHVRTAVDMEAYDSNYVGGDINTGVQDIFQQFTRPVLRLNPYSTPIDNIFICSSATPPGGGVHGMCGYYAAQAALKRL